MVVSVLNGHVAQADHSCSLLQTSSEIRRKKGKRRAMNQTLTAIQPLNGAASKSAGICLPNLTEEEWCSFSTEKYEKLVEFSVALGKFRIAGWRVRGAACIWVILGAHLNDL